MFIGSGAIKDNFLVFGQSRDHGEKFRRQQRPGEMNGAAMVVAGIGTDQEALAGFNPGMRLGWRNAWNHDSYLFDDFQEK